MNIPQSTDVKEVPTTQNSGLLSSVGLSEIQRANLRATSWIQTMLRQLYHKANGGTESDIFVQRVNQLDALQLDNDLTQMLSYQIRRIFKFFQPGFLTTYKPEIEAFIHALIFRYTIYTDTPSPGNRLQNLCYRNERAMFRATSYPLTSSLASSSSSSSSSKLNDLKVPSNGLGPGSSKLHFFLSPTQKILYFLLAIVGKWGWVRLNQHMLRSGWAHEPSDSWQKRFYVACKYMERHHRLLQLLNLLVFLSNGRYRTLIERVLSMRLVYLRPRLSRAVSFEFMHQHLLWQNFSEFLLFMLPLINFQKVIRFGKKLFGFLIGGQRAGYIHPPGCPVCKSDPILTPSVSSCGHLFCYYCLRASRIAEANYTCPLCYRRIVGQEPYIVSKHGRMPGVGVGSTAVPDEVGAMGFGDTGLQELDARLGV